MKNSKLLSVCLLLCAIVATTASSCGSETATDTQKENTSVTGAVTDTAVAEDTELQSNLPLDTLDFGGREIRLTAAVCFPGTGEENYFAPSEISGDVVFDAVFNRNQQVENDLNVKMVYTFYDGNDGNTAVNKSIMAGDDAIDIVNDIQWLITPLMLKNEFLNLSDLPYLDLDQPWWSDDYISEMSVGDSIYFVAGDITLGTIRYMDCIYVNKEVYEQYVGEREEIYDDVMNGTWTLDKLAANCKVTYRDLNGDGTMDDGDLYGIGVVTESHCDHFVYDAGLTVTERDENNIPYIVLNSEHTINLTNKMIDLYYNNQGSHIFPGVNDSLNYDLPAKLAANELLYLPGWFYTSEYMRDMDFSYAVIPFPKYDETQESYLSLVHDIANVVSIPTTAHDTEQLAAVMEDMAFLGYRDVLPAYYEIAMKIKYSRDDSDTSMQILDIIHDNATTDFGYIFNYSLGDIGLIERTLVGKQSNDFVSLYTKNESKYTKALDKLLASFEEAE